MPHKILISTIYTDDWDEIVSITKPHLVAYCERHGYSYTYTKYDRGLKDFDKIRVLLDIMKHNHYEFVWALDADAVITNFTIPIEEYLDDVHELFICKDINSINCGSFILRRGIWAEWLLAWLLDTEGMSGKYCEQDGMNEYLQCFPSQANRKVKFLPHPSINSYLCELYDEYKAVKNPLEQWSEEKFVLHLPGIDNKRRIEILNQVRPIQ